MYIKLSYDGRIISTSAYPNRRVSSDVSLDSSNELVIEVDDGSIYYYDDWDDDSYCKGKIKYIGRTLITYNDFDSDSTGKVRYIGNILITYNDDWDDDSFKKGKVRYVGNTLVTYYDDDYESYKVGRVKTVGDTFIYW